MEHKGTTGRMTAASLLVALGIIYGDIGTSPLYVLKAIVGEKPIGGPLVYGGISCVFWTLTFQTSFKYIFLTLRADNHGEGGVFSLYALVRRYSKHLVIPTILGATTLLADGIITPPISVASAVEGLTIVQGLEHMPTVPIVVVILSLLFFFQRYGTQKVGSAFGPAMLVWFTMLIVLGSVQLVAHPDILRALSPVYAYRFLTEYPHAFWLLGAVFLATTGAEALYSDLGHCGRRNIRITWLFVKSALVINYMGQAAWMMEQGEGALLNGRNPFFEVMPSWFLVPGIVIATMAAIIASQALISGSYTLICEAMNLNFWPRITVRQPTELKGQIYIPSVNTILWVGCILMILYFRSSTHMEAAYGFSITVAMMMTTVLLMHFLYFRLRWPLIAVGLLLVLFATVEVSFFIANVAKIKERWMFLFFELFIFLVMYTWYYARKINNRLTRFVDLGEQVPALQALSVDEEIPKFATHLVYLTKADRRHEVEEKIVRSIFSKRPKRADVYWLVHIHRVEDPYTLSYEVSELVDDKLIKVTINAGFRLQPRTATWFNRIMHELVANKELNLHTRPDGSTRYNAEPDVKYVVIEKFLSIENDFTLRNSMLLNSYFLLKRLGQSDAKAFGLERNDVVVEQVPLVFQPAQDPAIARVHKDGTGTSPDLYHAQP
ncbi:MAG: KUP/HAK/KT family potassium transporter [Flavobacteriales bacterium]|nr:KUP/HAK/KT family potassium transporter [Flavobacteriales bacterium]